MKLKDSIIKKTKTDIWLHHIKSGYKVRINEETLNILDSMMKKKNSFEMDERQKFIYEKLKSRNMIDEDLEYEKPMIKNKSLLESIEIEFSGRCNLRCKHCFSSLSGKDMSVEIIDKILIGIDDLEPVNLIISGGEPLLNSNLEYILRESSKRNMRIIIMSNGILVNPKICEILSEYGIAKIVVSLDFFKDFHDFIRGEGSFEKTVFSIKTLKKYNLPVFITAMVKDKNVCEIEDFKKFCLEELGVLGIRFSPIMPIGRAKENSYLVSIEVNINSIEGDCDNNDGMKSKDISAIISTNGFYCGAGIKECFISSIGLIYPCHYFQNLNEPIGDLNKNSFKEIYELYSKSDSIGVNFDWKEMKECLKCDKFYRCKGGCRARAKLLTDDWYSKDLYSCMIYFKGKNYEKRN